MTHLLGPTLERKATWMRPRDDWKIKHVGDRARAADRAEAPIIFSYPFLIPCVAINGR